MVAPGRGCVCGVVVAARAGPGSIRALHSVAAVADRLWGYRVGLAGRRLTAGRIDRTQHGNGAAGGEPFWRGVASGSARCIDGRCRGGGVRPVSALPKRISRNSLWAAAGTRSALDDSRCTAGDAEAGDGVGCAAGDTGLPSRCLDDGSMGAGSGATRTHRLRLIGLEFLLVGHPQDPTVIGWGGLHHGMRRAHSVSGCLNRIDLRARVVVSSAAACTVAVDRRARCTTIGDGAHVRVWGVGATGSVGRACRSAGGVVHHVQHRQTVGVPGG